MSEKNYRKALLTVKRLNRDTGGNALRGAMDSFSRQRQQNFDRPANGGDAEALALANSNSSPPQLLIADPPQQQQSTSKDMASQATDFGSALDDGIGMLTGRNNAKPSPVAAPSSAQSQPVRLMSATPTQDDGTALGALKRGISGEESGGKYDILGPVQKSGDYAVGKYQIMASNVPSWTKQALGHSMTPDQFRADPQAQEDVTSHILGGYLNQYGPKGAAAMWFSGKPDISSSARDSLGTSVPNYVANATRDMSAAPIPQSPAPSAPPSNQPIVGDGQYRNRANDAPSPPGYKEFGRNSDGPVSAADIPQDNDMPQAKRGGFMRKHFDDGGGTGGPGTAGGDGSGDGGATGVGGEAAATGFSSSVNAAPGNVGYGSTADGDNGAGFASSADASGTGGGGSAGPAGSPAAGHGQGGGGGSAAPGGSGGATGVGGAATGGGGGTASGGSGHGGVGTGAGSPAGGNGGGLAGSTQAVAQQHAMQALQAAMNQHAISFGADPGVASLGVPAGVGGQGAAPVGAVTSSPIGPPAYSQATINATNAFMTALQGHGATTGQGANTGYAAGFGGGSPGQTVGGLGGNTNSTGAEGVSTAGLGSGSPGAGAATASPPAAVLGYAPSQGTNSPAVTAMQTAMRGTPAQNQSQQTAAPVSQQAANNSGGSGRYANTGFGGASSGSGGKYASRNTGGIVSRASGGEVANMPTPELIARALEVLARRKAASGGKQTTSDAFTTALLTPSASSSKTAATPSAPWGSQQYIQNLGAQFAPAGAPLGIQDNYGREFEAFTSPFSSMGGGGGGGSQAAAAPTAPPAPITPALDGQTIGNSFDSGSGNPMGQIPMASPGGNGYGGAASGAPTYQNTLNEVLGTNSPTQDQIFGFKYPVPPAPKPQPQGPVSQDQINQSYGFGGGSQIGTGTGLDGLSSFAAGGAIIMDVLLRANRARKAKGNK